MANSIEELAIKMKLPVKTFKAMVTRYNKLARLGKDLDFGKRPDKKHLSILGNLKKEKTF
jgi:fumarate reductase flavoprotein subunit